MRCTDQDQWTGSQSNATHIEARDQRDAFDEQDLKNIFNLRKLKSESIDKNKSAYYWVPLLGLYTGARLNELCQLYVNDIKEIDLK